jgi:hypothetical protein
MIAVVMMAGSDMPRLGAALTALVGPAVDGLVKAVTLIAPADDAEVALIAEDMGAAVAPQIAAACGPGKGEWLMILPQPVVLAAGWDEAVGGFVSAGPGAARLSAERAGGFTLPGGGGGGDGLLIERTLYQAAGGWLVGDQSRRLLSRLGRGGAAGGRGEGQLAGRDRLGHLRILSRR